MKAEAEGFGGRKTLFLGFATTQREATPKNWTHPKNILPLLSSLFPPNKRQHRTTTMAPTSSKRKAEDITKGAEPEEAKKDDVIKVAEEVAAAAAATVADADASMEIEDKDDEDGPESGSKRRFFPRVKHLLTPEWEPFLVGVLDALDEAAAPTAACASHKATNPWYKAFNSIYTGVARDCSIPHGKNRYHKFKDKIVELWQGVESHTGDDLPLRDRALAQYEEYKKSCTTQAITPKKEGSATPKTPGSLATPRMASLKTPSSTRRFLSGAMAWKHLDEKVVLETLPEPLKSLVHIRHLVQELGTPNTTVKEQYDKALEEYLKDIPEGKDALYEKSLGLAFLFRYALNAEETKDIKEVYERVVSDYLVVINDSLTSTSV